MLKDKASATKRIIERFKALVLPLSHRDRPQMKKFLAEYFKSGYVLTDDEFFDWQYLNNPHNFYEGYSVKVLKDSGRFLGYLGLVPYKFKVFDTSYENGGALCNLMIDNSCRTIGLGAVLVHECQKDFVVMTGTSYKPKTGPMYQGIGNWVLMGDLRRFVRVLNPEKCAVLENPQDPPIKKYNALVLQKEAGVSRKFEFLQAKAFDGKVDDLWQKARKRYLVCVERSAQYLNWRYAQHPKLKYQIHYIQEDSQWKGYVVTRVEEPKEGETSYKIARIIDLVCTQDCEQQMIAWHAEEMKRQGADLIDFFFTGNYHEKGLRDAGFIDACTQGLENLPHLFNPISRTKKGINFLIYYDDKLASLRKDLSDIGNWYITRGEGDQDRPN